MNRRRWLVIGLGILALTAALVGTWPNDTSPDVVVSELCEGYGCPDGKVKSFQWVWPDEIRGSGIWEWHSGVFLGETSVAAPADLYTAEFLVNGEGEIRQMRRATNLTKTADSEESFLVSDGQGRVAFGAYFGDHIVSIHLLDFHGESKALTSGWSTQWQLANQINNLQRTGRFDGIHWRTYVFRTPQNRISMNFDNGVLAVMCGNDGSFIIDSDGTTDASQVIVQEMVKGRPAFLAWAVDTVRAIPWVGRRRIERLEQIWFNLNDWWTRTKYELKGDESEEETIGTSYLETAVSSSQGTAVKGWPPKNIGRMLKRSKSKTEGVWIVADEPGFTPTVHGPPLFYKTYVKPDPERPYSKVHLVTWDPSRVALRMMAGVREPQSTTGLKGKGEIPREPQGEDHISRLVGAFNGAFQALHGEWGMVVNRQTFLPPRAYGATIAVLTDGRVGMGTWPHPVGDFPEELSDIRQNINSLVEGGVFNPYKRTWWGGVPDGIEERVVTARSGICLTFEGKLIYFWGRHLSPESLGDSMIAADCDYGLHLDMNTGHCGFEYYNTVNKDTQVELNRELDTEMEAHGAVAGRDDLVFWAKKMTDSMGSMRFPRYIGRDPRDFFYLLLKPSVFDEPPQGAANWEVMTSNMGAPVPAVTLEIPNEVLYKFDTSQVEISVESEKPQAEKDSTEKDNNGVLLAIPFTSYANGIRAGLIVNGEELSPLQRGAPELSVSGSSVKIGESGGGNSSSTVIQGVWPSAAKMINSQFSLGVDRNGYIVVSKSADGQSAESVPLDKKLILMAPTDHESEVNWLVFRNAPTPSWVRLFEDVKPVPPSVWRSVFRERGKLLDHSTAEDTEQPAD